MRYNVIALGRNYLLSLAGEGFQSGFHFILNLVLIRALTPYDYGLFGIILILGGIALTYGNALASIPAAIHMPKLKNPNAVRFQEVVFGSAAVAISVSFALAVTVVLSFATGQTLEALAGGVFVGLWTLRNHLRAVLFARGTTSAVTLADLGYSVSGMGSIAMLLWLHSGISKVALVLSMLAAANAISIFVALRSLAMPIRISFGRGACRRYRAIWPEIKWSLIGTTTWTIQGQAPMFLVAAIVGPAAYAPIAAGLVLFSPLRPAVGAFINVVRPKFSADLATARHETIKLTLFSSFSAIVLCCLSFGVAIWLAWGFLGEHIFGDKFAAASLPLIVTLVGITTIFSLSYHTPLALVQAAHNFKSVTLATTLGGLVGLGGAVTLLFAAGVAWSLAGLAAGEVVCWVCLWLAALRVLFERPATSLDAASHGSDVQATPLDAEPVTVPQPRHSAVVGSAASPPSSPHPQRDHLASEIR